jgi:NADPH:quinone reductase-like Zn-dependent oxidoreductase
MHSQYGNPEVLQVTTLERPVPQKNEVLIRVKAAGLDYGQWHLMAGKPYALRLATGLTKPKQRVLGMDVSGAVEAVGAEVTRFKVGDAVFGAASRTFAEFTCAREDQLCLKPERLSFEQVAASAISGVTALIGLRDEVGGFERQRDVAAADRRHPMIRDADHARDRGKRHLRSQHQHQRLEQQREARELARERRFDQAHRTVGQRPAV